jgi:hypothetical protein
VLVGAAAGTAMGILLPVVFHPRADAAEPAPPATTSPAATQVLSFGAAF